MAEPQQPDDWPDDLDEPELPDEDDDSAELLPCPECGAEIYEDSPRCPVCGAYVIHDTSVWSGRSWWWIVLGLLGVVAVVLTLALGG